jgi:hypothetical protein
MSINADGATHVLLVKTLEMDQSSLDTAVVSGLVTECLVSIASDKSDDTIGCGMHTS